MNETGPVELKGEIYRTVGTPVCMYGAETWSKPIIQKHRLEVSDIRMLRT